MNHTLFVSGDRSGSEDDISSSDSAREANLLEDPGRAMKVQDNSFSFELRPFEIKTFVIE